MDVAQDTSAKDESHRVRLRSALVCIWFYRVVDPPPCIQDVYRSAVLRAVVATAAVQRLLAIS